VQGDWRWYRWSHTTCAETESSGAQSTGTLSKKGWQGIMCVRAWDCVCAIL